MSEAVVIRRARAPLHLWIVGAVSLLWNAYGAFDYLMTQTRNEAYMSGFSQEQLAYFYGMPAWADAFWALGVWGAVLGSVLLLLRHRFAVWAFAASLVGLVVTTAQSYLDAASFEVMGGGAAVALTVGIFVIAIALLAYALRMRQGGVLR